MLKTMYNIVIGLMHVVNHIIGGLMHEEMCIVIGLIQEVVYTDSSLIFVANYIKGILKKQKMSFRTSRKKLIK